MFAKIYNKYTEAVAFANCGGARSVPPLNKCLEKADVISKASKSRSPALSIFSGTTSSDSS
jgi:hypothetical protein